MSNLQTTSWALVTAAAAVLVLVGVDRVKTFRPVRLMVRGRRGGSTPVAVVHEPTPRYRPTPWWRRVLAAGGLGAFALVLGVSLAILVAIVVIGGLLLAGGIGG